MNNRTIGKLETLLKAARKALEGDGGLTYYDRDDDVGTRTCCQRAGYKPHEPDCWVPRLAEAVRAFEDEPA